MITSLKEAGLSFGNEVRILNPQYFVHCHNKLVNEAEHMNGECAMTTNGCLSSTAIGPRPTSARACRG
jgi:hypothetical protein